MYFNNLLEICEAILLAIVIYVFPVFGPKFVFIVIFGISTIFLTIIQIILVVEIVLIINYTIIALLGASDVIIFVAIVGSSTPLYPLLRIDETVAYTSANMAHEHIAIYKT